MEESLARAIQELLGSSKEEFIEDTIIGSDVNQIRHLFYYLRSEKQTLGITYQSEHYRGIVTHVHNTSVVLHVPGFEETPIRRCQLKFEAASVLYQFEVLILEFGRDRITIKLPYFIQSAKQRKHKRIPTQDLFMKFIFLYQPFFNSTNDLQMVESRYFHLMEEIRKDDPDIFLVARMINKEAQSVTKDYEVTFYKPGSKRTFLEEAVGREKKTLFMDNVNQAENYYKLRILYGLINFHKSYLAMVKETSEEGAIKFFEEMRLRDLHQFKKSYLCAPLLIFDQVVGHIYMQTSQLDNLLISQDQAHQMDLLASIFSYALTKKVIARSYYSHPITRIVNISMSGLLFELNNRTIFDYLVFQDMLKLEIQIRTSLLEFVTEITRYFPTESGYNIGVNFLSANPEDFKILENYIFENRKLIAG